MTQRSLTALVLAAGEGTRMRSSRPKPLHLLCGRAMLLYVLDSVVSSEPTRAVVVVGHGAERVTKKLQEDGPELVIDFVEQHVPRGTGDAVSVGLTALPDDELDEAERDVLVLPGDTPLLRAETIEALVARHRTTDAACTVLTARVPDPTGYGRVVRDKDDRVARIVEQADAFGDELDIDEINTSIYCFRGSVLAPALRRLSPENAQGEYYLTDVVEVLHDAGYPVFSLVATDFRDTQGVNDRVQLAEAEAELRRRTNESWLRRGVTMLDPAHTYIDATVSLGTDVTLFPGTMLQGRCVIGDGAEIGPNARLVDCIVGAGAVVEQTTGRDSEIGASAHVGPFAVLPPGSDIAVGLETGPFYTAGGGSGDGGVRK
jgi:bifunctional UDP-N-acetylglucosamine pyrophosphorylase/glucosamine-1-phosphate N-acetyltransferase